MIGNERTEILIGKENINKLSNSKILIVGIGGVGGYVCEALARMGCENLTIVDGDKVDKSNLNRQIIALNSTINQSKVLIMEQRIKDINPLCVVRTKNMWFNKDTVNDVFDSNYDFVVDAIDKIDDKVLLIKTAKAKNIKIVSALGAGNRTGKPNFEITDIFKTYNDGLAKVLRKKLKENNIESLNVAFSAEKPLTALSNDENVKIGSIVYSPAICGLTISWFVSNEIIKC